VAILNTIWTVNESVEV